MNGVPLCRLPTVTPFTVDASHPAPAVTISNSENHTIGRRPGLPRQPGVPLTLSDRPDTVTA